MDNGNDFRKLKGRRGPNNKEYGINYMKGSFVVQFFDENVPEKFVINDDDPNTFNNEIRSNSPLAKAVMNNAVGSSFFIDSFIYGKKTSIGITIFKKDLKYINYNPEFDDKVQFNYYYTKSYLDYVKPRDKYDKSDDHIESNKEYIDFKYVNVSTLNKSLTNLINKLEIRLNNVRGCLSIKHIEDCKIKIKKLSDLKNKKFYKEDLEFIEKDIYNFIKDDIGFFSIMDVFSSNLMKYILEFKFQIPNKDLKIIEKNIKELQLIDTIKDGEILIGELSNILKKYKINLLNNLTINFDYDFDFDDDYEYGKKHDYTYIYNYYSNRVSDYLFESEIDDRHRSIFLDDFPKQIYSKYNDFLSYEKMLKNFIGSDLVLFLALDSIANKFANNIYKEKDILGVSFYENLLKKVNFMRKSDTVEEEYLILWDLIDTYNKNVSYELIINNGIIENSFSDIDDLIVWLYLQGKLDNHKDLIVYLKNRRDLLKSNNKKTTVKKNESKSVKVKENVFVEKKNVSDMNYNDESEEEETKSETVLSNNLVEKTKEELLELLKESEELCKSQKDEIKELSNKYKIIEVEYETVIQNNKDLEERFEDIIENNRVIEEKHEVVIENNRTLEEKYRILVKKYNAVMEKYNDLKRKTISIKKHNINLSKKLEKNEVTRAFVVLLVIVFGCIMLVTSYGWIVFLLLFFILGWIFNSK